MARALGILDMHQSGRLHELKRLYRVSTEPPRCPVAQVVQVEVHGSGAAAQQQFRAFARTYFTQFTRTPFGMLRLDPQDAGPGIHTQIPGASKCAP